MNRVRRQCTSRFAREHWAPCTAAAMALFLLLFPGARLVADLARPMAVGIQCIGSLPKAVIQGDTLPLLEAIGVLVSGVAGDSPQSARDARSCSEPDSACSAASIPAPTPVR
jgi:hypothetical protein